MHINLTHQKNISWNRLFSNFLRKRCFHEFFAKKVWSFSVISTCNATLTRYSFTVWKSTINRKYFTWNQIFSNFFSKKLIWRKNTILIAFYSIFQHCAFWTKISWNQLFIVWVDFTKYFSCVRMRKILFHQPIFSFA